mgnify:CR=1 FL=1
MSYEGNNPIRVSAIVPVCNVERYVRQCLDTLLAQTYPLVEIVLVDDGSTDSSGAICDEYAAAHDRVTVVHKQNAGLGYTRNTGLDNLTRPSDYVMFVDSDDWLEENAVEYLVGALGADPADCVIGGHTKKTAEGKTVFELKLENRRFEGVEVREELLPRLCGSMPTSHDSVPMSACSALYRRSMLEEHNLRFPSEREMISEDFVFKFYFLLHARTAVLSDFTGYCYRTVQGSLTTSYRPDRFEACVRFYKRVQEMVREESLSDECLLRLDKTFFIYLRMCIKQERPKVSGSCREEALRSLQNMVSADVVQKAIESYPVSRLGIRQRFFVRLVEKRQASTLLALANAGAL